jgi:PAS domain S-box-containing protein
LLLDANGHVQFHNQAAARLFGWDSSGPHGEEAAQAHAPEDESRQALIERCRSSEALQGVEMRLRKKEGEALHLCLWTAPLRHAEGEITGTVAAILDVTEQKRLEMQLAQTHKLESIGQLAAGVAHEINTPIQYVGDNTRFLNDAFTAVAELLEAYDRLLAAAKNGGAKPDLLHQIETQARETDVAYLRNEIPKAIHQSLEGVEQVARIVRAMKEFSHPGLLEKTVVDVNRAIESTIIVSRNEWRYVADLVADLDPDLPPVLCLPGELSQVILNLIVNAAHAVADMKEQVGSKGTIKVTTRRDQEWAEIRVTDTGIGIPESVRPNIFNPFFTTKEVGKGTGQGLALVHSVVVQKHGGSVSFDTEVGVGTTFVVRLPIGAAA